MKKFIEQIKEILGKLSSKTKKIIVIALAVVLVGAIVIAIILNNKPYEVLFSGLGEEEAQQIVTKLQEDGVKFRYDNDSTISVPKDILDKTKAQLVQEGYPKSGFTYDTFTENASMMTTDSDKNTYKLYELQDRIGSTIRLFDGVKDAKVTIALGEESKYALSKDAEEKSSATAVVTMENGGSPTKEQAAAIQRLVAKSVPKMEMEDVAVFDGNGEDVSTDADSSADSSDAEEIAKVVEKQIDKKVMKVLGPIYGEKNVKVSSRAQINMEELIRESTTYNTPEKINEEDKTGIIEQEDTYTENSNVGNNAAGVAGSETNADTAQYNTNGDNGGSNASSESSSRKYLVDQVKEQEQVSPGALDDLTVSVAINGNNYGSLTADQIRSLVGNAAGIPAEERVNKISIASAPFYEAKKEDGEGGIRSLKDIPASYWIIAAVALLLLIALVVILVIRSKRRKEEEIEEEESLQEEIVIPVKELNEEIQEIQNDRGMELKKNVREFTEQNSEISAQLLKNWLNGGGGDGQ